MGKLKKVGIGFGIIIGIFFVLAIESTLDSPREKVESRGDSITPVQPREDVFVYPEKTISNNSNAREVSKEEFEKLSKEYYDSVEQKNLSLKLDSEEKVLDFIGNYQGQDNSGNTLFETVAILLNTAYPNENILKNPSTTGYLIADWDYNRDLSGRYWKVEWEIQTYKETTYWIWLVDTDTNTIYAGNVPAKGILDILDTFD